ncbi:MAG: bifunctional hydroxymethylpyrimidine kinase/phosphomethylpyrimidine kinase [Alphaproteobacteria bacterium]|nr:bifunctional hydroxymethylpyrimidine kinase/phosphomethylpyrimidine kinase [Alphaproteobacteria bacterium]
MIHNLLTIAGSDPSGGAGIQADLKTFSALGCYGMSVLTALTAQNTQGVFALHDPPPDFIAAQIEAVFNDIRVDAVKIGMAGTAEAIHAIADALERLKPPFIIVDPVIVATSGDALIFPEAVETLKTRLVPLADILTPNIPESAALLGRDTDFDEETAHALLALGPRSILLKGGHGGGDTSPDIFAAETITERLEAPRIKTCNTHGTGCTLSAALAAFLARGLEPLEAARAAKAYLTEAIRHADMLDVGKGSGPVHHFWHFDDLISPSPLWGEGRGEGVKDLDFPTNLRPPTPTLPLKGEGIKKREKSCRD